MTVHELLQWHREQKERFDYLAENHKTTGANTHRNAVTRRNRKQAEFHAAAENVLMEVLAEPGMRLR